jgi:4-hydroxybenzoate polyprenyltransferase
VLNPPHLLFLLPQVYLAALICTKERLRAWPTGWEIVLITLAMVSAQFVGMILNALTDRKIDEQNSRTAKRVVVTGELSRFIAWSGVLKFTVVFLFAAGMLSPLALSLSFIALLFIWAYAYTKRFTWLCHVYLGVTTSLGIPAVWIALNGQINLFTILLFSAATLWVAGFDIVYGSQDIEFDQAHQVYSIPARFGLKLGLKIAASVHIAASLLWFLFGYLSGCGLWFFCGWLVISSLLAYEHYLLRGGTLEKVNTSFFTLNSLVSILLCAATLVDRLVFIPVLG